MRIIQIFCHALLLYTVLSLECKLFIYLQKILFNNMSLDFNVMLHVEYLFVFQ